jgi:hypothetical protein
LGASATILAAMILGGLPAHISYGQTKSHPAAPSPSDGVTSPVQFDVVSVKIHNPDNRESRMQLTPDGVRLSNLPLQDLIVQAYGLVLSDQIVGLPNWANSERFDYRGEGCQRRCCGISETYSRSSSLDGATDPHRPL